MSRTWKKTSMLVAVAAGLALAVPVVGQARNDRKAGGAGKAKSSRAAEVKPAEGGGSGLGALSDDALLSELAGRQMQGLLDHAFEENKTPEDQRLAMLAMPAIARLRDPNADLARHEKLQLINQIAAGADKVVASIDDPAVLMEQSTVLIKEGVEPEVNLMEFWGESPKVQQRLKPIIGAVMKMLDKAIKTGSAQRAKLEKQLDGRNERLEKQWEEFEALVNTAEYTRAMVTYNEAMAVPANAKGLEQRTKLADRALEFLQSYDNADQGVQAAVRNRMGKLMMIKREYGPANELFETVVSGQIDEKTKIDPPPTPEEQYEARYFSAVAEMMQGDLERAKKGLEEVVAWQKANATPEALPRFDANSEMLRYRLLMKERDKLKDPAGKRAAEEAAFAVLLELFNKQPDLRSIISEQLVDALGDDIDVKTQKVLILQAMVSKAYLARAAADPKAADPALQKQIEQGIQAAREMLARKGQDPAVTDEMASRAALAVPLLYQAMGRPIEAANGFIDFVEKKQGEPKLVKSAFSEAGAMLVKLTTDEATKADPGVTAAWERFLPIAVEQFKRTEYAFDLASRLRQKNPPQLEQAVKYLRMVPPKNRGFATAKFFEMITLTDMVYAVGADQKPLLQGERRAATVQETLKVAEENKQIIAAGIKAAKSPAEAMSLRSRLAVVTLIQAELAASGEKPDWQRVLDALKGFEGQTKGLDNADQLNKKVMELRVPAYMQLNQFQQAADELIKLLEREPGGRAAGLVLSILRKLNDDYDRAIAQGNTELAKKTLEYRANLSGFLVKWAAGNKDPNVKKNLYTYTVYDADTQRLNAAAQAGDARTKGLQKAMVAFQNLRLPANVAAYKVTVADRKAENPEDKTDPEAPDPAVTLGMAMTSYDLGDWKTASQELKKLRFGGRLGSRQIQETDAKTGETRVVPNNQYWEAMYKYYNATYQWAKSAPEDADAQAELSAVKTLLRRDYVAGPEDVGGVKWREAFEALRKELIPDLDLKTLKQPGAAGGGGSPAPSTQPKAGSRPAAVRIAPRSVRMGTPRCTLPRSCTSTSGLRTCRSSACGKLA